MLELESIQVSKAGELAFGEGKIGLNPALGSSEETAFAAALGAHTRELWKQNTADCGDGRGTVRLVQTETGLTLMERVVPQLFGGSGLAATKAAVAADARLVADAKTMWQAYEKVSTYLHDKWGEEDGGHEGCGASKGVRSSVAQRIEPEVAAATIGLLAGLDLSEDKQAVRTGLTQQNWQTVQDRLEAGFYDGWEPAKHADYLSSRFPQNFSYLDQGDPDDPLGGHREVAVYVVTEPGSGFAKNAFIEVTGQQAFAVTLPKMRQLADKLGADNQEKARIFLAFLDDTLQVANGLVARGLPVFSSTASA